MRNEIGQRQELHRSTGTDAKTEPENSADHGEHGRLGEKLTENVVFGRANRFASTNLPRALGYRNQHDIHYTDPAQAQRDDGHAAKEYRDHAKDFIQQLRAFHRVPDKERVFVDGIEEMNASHRLRTSA